jgi:sugar lactone lactonase YvrE
MLTNKVSNWITLMFLIVSLSFLGCADDDVLSVLSDESLEKGLLPGQVETILSLPVGDNPEGIALDKSGNIYVGNRRTEGAGRVNEILRITRDGDVSVFATLPAAVPEADGVLGLDTDPTGNVYAAYVTYDPTTQGVYRISQSGSVERLAGSDAISFANALAFDASGNLYVTDSFVGTVWRFGPDWTAELWVQDVLLEPLTEDPLGFPVPGANGIAFYPPNHLYVANTEKGLIAHIPIELQGGNAGTPELVAAGFDLFTIDGIAVDTQGDIHGVVPGFTILGTLPLIRVNPTTGEVTPTVIEVSEAAKFDVPLSLAFGKGRDKKSVFVTNGDLPVVPGGPGPGVVQVGVGVCGL